MVALRPPSLMSPHTLIRFLAIANDLQLQKYYAMLS